MSRFGPARSPLPFEQWHWGGKGAPSRYKKRVRIWNMTGGYCFYCEKPLDFRWDFDADHVFCKHLGGPNTFANIVPACSFCNRSKGPQDGPVWAKRMGYWRALEDIVALFGDA